MTQAHDGEADARRFGDHPAGLLVGSVLSCGLCLLDGEGIVRVWNPGAERITGFRASETQGRTFALLFTPEERAEDLPWRALADATSHGRFEREGLLARKDGSRFFAGLLLTRVVGEGENDAPAGFSLVLHDLSSRSPAEENARRAEDRFHKLVDSVTDYAVFLLDRDGNVETWNEGARRAKGYAADEIVGRHFSTFYTEGDRAEAKPARILETVRREGRFEEEGWRVRKDGSQFWANVVITALRDDKGEVTGFAKVTRDLTARHEAERIRRRLQSEQSARLVAEQIAARAQEANRVKDDFLAVVSHELRTPLNAIVGWADILRKEPLEGTVAKGIEVIDRNARAQVRIVDDILDVARIMSGKLRIEPQRIDLATVVQSALDVVRPTAEAKAIALALDIATPDTELFADGERLQQVVWNLLSNAVKFTHRGGHVTLTLSRTGADLVVTVSDDGRGMDAAFLSRAFDRFLQEDTASARRIGGLGLGLALVRQIVELHGGSVTAQSPGLGLGATLRIQLPAQPPAHAASDIPQPSEAPEASPAPALDGLPLAGVHIVLVEDDDDARALLASTLVRAGARVDEAASAAAGLVAVRDRKPHILLSDIAMPGVDGYALLRRIRAVGGVVPAIAITALTSSADKARAEEVGFARHLGKPLAPDDVIRAIREVPGRG